MNIVVKVIVMLMIMIMTMAITTKKLIMKISEFPEPCTDWNAMILISSTLDKLVEYSFRDSKYIRKKEY